MIIQININNTNKYDTFIEHNRKYFDRMDHKIFSEKDVSDFLINYCYYDIYTKIQSKITDDKYKQAILCDFVRLAVLYEFGGIYLDLDIYFNPSIIELEQYMQTKYKNFDVFIPTSLYFFRCRKHSDTIKQMLNEYLISDEISCDAIMVPNEKKLTKNSFIMDQNKERKFFKHVYETTNDVSRFRRDSRI